MRRDLQRFTRLFLLVLHFELGNFELGESLYRSTRRYLELNPPVREAEALVLKALWKVFGDSTKSAVRATCGETHKRLQEIKQQSENGFVVGFHEISIWLRAKAEDRVIAEVAKEELLETGN